MVNGNEKSDDAVVAPKLANKAERSVAERGEQRAETEGNADWQSTHRTQSLARVSQAQTHRGATLLSVADAMRGPTARTQFPQPSGARPRSIGARNDDS